MTDEQLNRWETLANDAIGPENTMHNRRHDHGTCYGDSHVETTDRITLLAAVPELIAEVRAARQALFAVRDAVDSAEAESGDAFERLRTASYRVNSIVAVALAGDTRPLDHVAAMQALSDAADKRIARLKAVTASACTMLLNGESKSNVRAALAEALRE